MTKRIRDAWKRYNKSTAYSLSDVYTHFSADKYRSYRDIDLERVQNNGILLKIVSFNTCMYTCGYIYSDDETGEMHFVYHTPTNRYDYLVSEIENG